MSALGKVDAVNAEYAQQRGETDSMVLAWNDIKKQLEIAEFKLTLASSVEKEQRAQIKMLNNRERLLEKEIRELKNANETLEIEYRHSMDDLERAKGTLDLIATELELSRAQSSTLIEQREEAQRQSETASTKLKFLGSKLLVVADENSKLQEKLAQSETALGAALQENQKLDDLVKEANTSLKTAEDSVVNLKAELSSIMLDDGNKKNTGNENASDKLAAYGEELSRLSSANLSLRNILDTLKTTNMKPAEEPLSPKTTDAPRPQLTVENLQFLLNSEYVKLQEAKATLDGVLAGLHLGTRSSTSASRLSSRHSKQNSGDSRISAAESLESAASAVSIHEVKAITMQRRKTQLIENYVAPSPEQTGSRSDLAPLKTPEPASSPSSENDSESPVTPGSTSFPEPTAVPLNDSQPAALSPMRKLTIRPFSQISRSPERKKFINFSRRRSLSQNIQPSSPEDKPASLLPAFEPPKQAPIAVVPARAALPRDFGNSGPKPSPESPVSISESMVDSSREDSAAGSPQYPRRRWSLRGFERRRSTSGSVSSVGSVNSTRLSYAPTFRDSQSSEPGIGLEASKASWRFHRPSLPRHPLHPPS